MSHGDAQQFFDTVRQRGNEHILKELKDAVVMTDFAPRSADTSSHSVRLNVRKNTRSFTGRKNFLRDLHQHIIRNQHTAPDVPTISTILSCISVVTGLGGIGKSETIRMYIRTYRNFYQHVVWIDAQEHTTAENRFRRLAQQELKLPSEDIDNKAKDFDVILKEIYDRLCTKPTLFILDNAETLHDSDPKRPGIARFLPTSLPPNHPKPVIIITSRVQDWPDLHTMPLPLWTPQESSAFIFRQLNLKDSDVNAKDFTMLSETFGGLPLALQAATAVIREESRRNELLGKDVYTIQHLLTDYNKRRREVLSNLPPDSPGGPPLMLLWKVSLDKIRQQPHGDLATQILNVMAHLSPTNIPKELLTFIFNSEDSVDSLVDAVALLVDYSFVHNSDTHFSIHRMLQDVTLSYLEAQTEERCKEGELSLTTYPLTRLTTGLKKYRPTFPKYSEAFDAVHDNLVHVTMNHVLPKAQNASETDLYLIEFIEFVFGEIKDTRRVEAEKCCRVLIDYVTNPSVPPNSASIFSSPKFKVQYLRRQLAGILETMGRYKEAVDIFQDLLVSFSALGDQKDVMPEILATKNSLASILDSQGEYEEAIKLYTSVIELCSKLHGPNDPFTLEAKNSLALARQKSRQRSEAMTLDAEILAVMMKGLGPLHHDTLATKHNIAMIKVKEGHYDEALELLREVVEVQERELGPLHTDTLNSKSCMDEVLLKHEKQKDAQRLYDCFAAKETIAVGFEEVGPKNDAKEMVQEVKLEESALGALDALCLSNIEQSVLDPLETLQDLVAVEKETSLCYSAISSLERPQNLDFGSSSDGTGNDECKQAPRIKLLSKSQKKLKGNASSKIKRSSSVVAESSSENTVKFDGGKGNQYQEAVTNAGTINNNNITTQNITQQQPQNLPPQHIQVNVEAPAEKMIGIEKISDAVCSLKLLLETRTETPRAVTVLPRVTIYGVEKEETFSSSAVSSLNGRHSLDLRSFSDSNGNGECTQAPSLKLRRKSQTNLEGSASSKKKPAAAVITGSSCKNTGNVDGGNENQDQEDVTNSSTITTTVTHSDTQRQPQNLPPHSIQVNVESSAETMMGIEQAPLATNRVTGSNDTFGEIRNHDESVTDVFRRYNELCVIT